MLQSAPGQTVDGRLRGVTWGIDLGVGMSVGKHLHVAAVPLIIDVMMLRPSNSDNYPFLKDDRPTTNITHMKLVAMAAF